MYIENEMKSLQYSITELKKSIDNIGSVGNYREIQIVRNDINDKFNNELLTTSDIAKLLKCNKNYVGVLLQSGLLPYLKLGSKKVRRVAFDVFLQKYEGWDLTDPYNPKLLDTMNEKI